MYIIKDFFFLVFELTFLNLNSEPKITISKSRKLKSTLTVDSSRQNYWLDFILILCVVFTCCVFLCMYMSCMCSYVWRTEVVRCLSLLLSTLIFQTGSLTEPRAHQLARQTGQWAPGASCFLPVPGLQTCITTPSFTCVSHLSSEPSPYFIFKGLFYF